MGGIYVDDAHSSDIPGALPLSAIGLTGSAQTPRPAISVNLKSFHLDPNNLQTGIEIADSSLQEGQGMHGNLSRADTYNTIAALGPDFNTGYTDVVPMSNADIAPTLAYIMHIGLPFFGTGRAASCGKRLSARTTFPRCSRRSVSRLPPAATPPCCCTRAREMSATMTSPAWSA